MHHVLPEVAVKERDSRPILFKVNGYGWPLARLAFCYIKDNFFLLQDTEDDCNVLMVAEMLLLPRAIVTVQPSVEPFPLHVFI